jgi:predicted transcriptional regulator
LGYPQKDFHSTLVRAIKRILDAPIVEREILLKEEGKGVNYLYIDEGLEEMNEIQKHLLRMGPKNTRRIHQKLREMALALGMPESQLPQPQIYIPRAR